MQYEVELKAWVDDPQDLERRLSERAVFLRNYDKQDTYYEFPDARLPQLRFRCDGNETFVTWKEKKLSAGIEQNKEHEFIINQAQELLGFLEKLGASVYIKKHKKGSAWKKNFFLLEFSQVEGLGYFLEIEQVLPEGTSQEVLTQTSGLLLQELESLGISRDRVEARPYTELLRKIAKT